MTDPAVPEQGMESPSPEPPAAKKRKAKPSTAWGGALVFKYLKGTQRFAPVRLSPELHCSLMTADLVEYAEQQGIIKSGVLLSCRFS